MVISLSSGDLGTGLSVGSATGELPFPSFTARVVGPCLCRKTSFPSDYPRLRVTGSKGKGQSA